MTWSVSVTLRRRLKVAPHHAWELLLDPQAVELWLGEGSVIPSVKGHRCVVADRAGAWADGRVVEFERFTYVRVDMERGGRPLSVTISLDKSQRAKEISTVLTVKVSQPTGTSSYAEPDLRAFWDPALDRLTGLSGRIRDRREQPRQAIVVIHGIGEQVPGATLRNFVDGVLDPDGKGYFKPDRVNDSFDIPRFTLPATASRPRTDVYELYWAHLVQGTTVASVTSWAFGLLWRRDLPARFVALRRCILVLALLVLAAVAAFAANPWTRSWPSWLKAVVLPAIGWAAWKVGLPRLRGAVTAQVGDAARYLSPKPGNVAMRREIRTNAVKVLRALSDSGRFDRIVMVGHSLGSMIAYDALQLFWTETNQECAGLSYGAARNVMRAERHAALESGAPGGTDGTDPQVLQHRVWQEMRANGQPWLVSDFVTIGSPLSMASFLMTDSPEHFSKMVDERRFSVAPPVTETRLVARSPRREHQRFSWDTSVERRDRAGRVKLTVLHHAAMFGAMRWTNLHFPSKVWGGDPIGGAVGGQHGFGSWVRDVGLAPLQKIGLRSHSSYWRPHLGSSAHTEAFAAAMHLDCVDELRSLLHTISPLMLLQAAQGDTLL